MTNKKKSLTIRSAIAPTVLSAGVIMAGSALDLGSA